MSPRRLMAVMVIVGAATMGVAGCASEPTEIASSTSTAMQSTIVTAAEQAAAGDSVAALATIDSLQAQLEQAIASGDVSASRAADIQQSIDLVRGDLQPTPVVEPAPAETAVPETTDDSVVEPENPGDKGNGNDGNNGNGNDKGNNGKGNGGNGKGNK